MDRSARTISSGTIEVLTFKRGLLSRAAHDLCLRLERFELKVDGDAIDARFFPDTLRVRGVMHDGVLDASAPSASDRAEIEDNVRDKILRTARHPEIRFTGTATATPDGHTIRGEVALIGRTQPLAVDVRSDRDLWRGEVEIVPSRWGIEPFKALFGAIQLQDRVRVRFEVPAG